MSDVSRRDRTTETTEAELRAARPETSPDLARLRDEALLHMRGRPQTGGDRDPEETIASDGPPGAGPPIDRGATLGRYVVLEPIAQGAMGVVLRGYDPNLHREVALKLVRARALSSEEAQARLLREAQALARLNHPNVVGVYDAEATEHGVYLAMEYVEGQTLRDWLDRPGRGWRSILDVLIAAGRGLAAAHAVGLVHRDVKPDNVMVGVSDAGRRETVDRVRVTDFGLARALTDSQDPNPSSADDVVGSNELTQDGMILGTPAYMAPEQHAATTADARADQYALCVMTWEALWGHRPFSGASAHMLYTAKREGPPPYPAGAVPHRVYKVLARGLAVDPEDRWPSMEAMLEALARDPGRSRRRFAMAAALVVGSLGVWGWQDLQQARETAKCRAHGDRITTAWNEQRREALTQTLRTAGDPGDAAIATAIPWLDEHAQTWRHVQTQACLDASVREQWDATTLERASWCLEQRRIELDTLVEELTVADPHLLYNAVPAVGSLTAIEPCRDPAVLAEQKPPPEAKRRDVHDVRTALSRAVALQRTGAYAAALQVAEAALQQALALDWPPVTAEARRQVGSLLEEAGDYSRSEAQLEDAFFEALQAKAMGVAAAAAADLVRTVGYRLARRDDGLRWGRHAEVLLRSVPDPGDLRLAYLLETMAGVHRSAGQYEEALSRLESARQIRETALGPDHPHVALNLSDLALVHKATGAYDEARQALDRALAIEEKVLGPDHPLVASTLDNLADLHRVEGRYDEAVQLFERCLAIQRAVHGEDHPDAAITMNNLAIALRRRGERDKARRMLERALVVQEKAFGPNHPEVAATVHNLGLAYVEVEQYERAEALFRRAVRIVEEVLGSDHPHMGIALQSLAAVHMSTGDYEAALTVLERALQLAEQALGPDHPDVATILTSLAAVHETTGDLEPARARYERALAVLERAVGAEHVRVAVALVGLANVDQRSGSHESAERGYRRALAITEGARGSELLSVADALAGLAEVALVRGQPHEAVELADRALSLRLQEQGPSRAMADARFLLARALWEAGDDRDRAAALAQDARDGYRAAGAARKRQLAELEAWLRRTGIIAER